MNNILQPGQHPDADQLSAFAENALPAHEREGMLAHLADCAHCRAVVSLALPPQDELLPQPAPSRGPWFPKWYFFWPALGAAACAAAFSTIHFGDPANRIEIGRPTQTAINAPPPLPEPVPNAPPATAKAPPAPDSPMASRELSVPPASKPAPVIVAPAPPTSDQERASGGIIDSRNISDLPLNARSYKPLGGPVNSNQLNQQQSNYAMQGAAKAAPVQAAPQPMAAPKMAIPPPPPPPAKIPATVSAAPQSPPPGTNMAMAESAAAPIVLNGTSTSYGAPARPPSPLPSRLPVASLLTSGTRTLALDTQGALFLSTDGGNAWLPVSMPWKGHAVRVALAGFTPAALRDKDLDSKSGAATSPAGSVHGSLSTPLAIAASLTGTVSDRTGATIPGASVTLRESRGVLLRVVQANRTGRYNFDGLPPDTYAVTAESPGFNSTQLSIALIAAKSVTANIILDVGSTSQTVEVSSDAIQLDTAVAKPRARRKVLAQPAPAVFEVTTETGEHWTSPDGQTWKHR